jgi:1-acyl-sn-glycerol-3-phosphate acyltransferase
MSDSFDAGSTAKIESATSQAATEKRSSRRKAAGQGELPPRPLSERVLYRLVRALSRLVGVSMFDLRCIGRHNLNFDGAALLLSTHQSTLDPVMVGISHDRELGYLARKTLFKSRLFAWLIRSLNAIEIDRESGGLAGLKETLKRLKYGKKVLIFPEGTRTSTGHPAELKPGFIALARRGGVPLVPIAVSGAFHALKRGSALPSYAPLCVVIGEPIRPEYVAQWDDDQLLAAVTERLWQCHRQALAQTLRAEQLRYE